MHIHKLVLLRHGESQWNLENRFTGWTDVELSENGIIEAKSSGQLLKDKGYFFDLVYTSVLRRAIQTMYLCLEEMTNIMKKLKICQVFQKITQCYHFHY